MQNAMLSNLKSVTIHELRESWDRRGNLMTLGFEAVPNQDYQRPQCINLVRTLISFLAPHFSAERFDEYEYAEINDCWIDYTWRKPELAEVIIRHKYWSDRQIDCFIAIVKALATYYTAEIIDERPGPFD